MKLQLSRQQQHEPPLRHQDSDLWLLTSRKRSQTPAQGWSLRWSGRKLDHQHRTGDQRLKDTNWVCQTNWWIDTRCLGYLRHNTQPCHHHSSFRWNTVSLQFFTNDHFFINWRYLSLRLIKYSNLLHWLGKTMIEYVVVNQKVAWVICRLMSSYGFYKSTFSHS